MNIRVKFLLISILPVVILWIMGLYTLSNIHSIRYYVNVFPTFT